MRKEYHLPTIQQTTLSIKQENRIIARNQEEDFVSKTSTIFPLKSQSKIDSGKETESEMSGKIFEEIAEGEDEESIEEFDPEDPAFQDNEEEEEEEFLRSPVVYKYDVDTKLYMRMDENEEILARPEIFQISETRSPTPSDEKQNRKEGTKPGSLKRKLQISNMTTTMATTMTAATTAIKNGEENETQNKMESGLKECKMQKMDLNNPLNVNNIPEEDGIMYVTVKGSKPNEILLVKVSKQLRKDLEKWKM
jgi:hypothetical protein